MPADETAEFRPVTDTEPPEDVVVETCVESRDGCTMHLPLRRIEGRWYSVTGFPFCMTREPTHWRPLT